MAEEEKVAQKQDAHKAEQAKSTPPKKKPRRGSMKMLTRRKKEFCYRGYSIEELKAMSREEVLDILPSRARRNMKRGLNEGQEKLLQSLKAHPDRILRTHVRDMIVLPEMVGRKLAIHSGKEFKEVEIQPEMIGHYLGEFVQTRKFDRHAGPGVGATRSSKFLPLK
jgi:small subunit ribosomal protein S19